MSRICGAKTTSGKPCKQVVEDHHDHCEAGHLCPPVKTGPSPKNAGLAPAWGSLDADSLLAGVPDQATEVAAKRVSDRLAWMKDSLATEEVEFVGTRAGLHNVLADPLAGTFVEIPHQVDMFMAEGKPVARGFVDRHMHWYLALPCSVDGCKETALVSMKGEAEWYGKGRLSSAKARRKAWAKDVDTAVGVASKALCLNHRAEKLLSDVQAEISQDLDHVLADVHEDAALEDLTVAATAAGGLELEFPVCPKCGSDNWSSAAPPLAKCSTCSHTWTLPSDGTD